MALRSIPGLISILALAGTGCFESIAPDRPDAGALSDAEPFGRYTTARLPDGSYTTRVDATSLTAWTYGDFETGAELAADGPWDLRFQRFHISTNGGASGSGGVEVAPVPGVPFAQVTAPPSAGWIRDIADGDDAGMEPDYAFDQGDGWYDYSPMTHVLRPKPLVWVVKTNGGSMIKLEILRYYDDAGTAGRFTLHWSPL
jgi:hypothetical protein